MNAQPPHASSKQQRLLLVTGMSGAGKSTAIEVLEDLGWEAIDNFPMRLLPSLVRRGDSGDVPLAIGVDSRTRGFMPAEIVREFAELSARDYLSVGTLFLDCASEEIQRRYNETRRRHPMARGRPVIEGIKAERELLEPLRKVAELVIDTTTFSAHELQQAVRERFAAETPMELTVTVTSFGFARGMPPLADLLFDMRFLDNPHWYPALRPQTGRDPAVADHIAADPAFAPAFAAIRDCVLELLPRYAAQDRAYLTIAFGCTGGRHRSVFTAEQMTQVLRAAGRSPTVIHRDLDARATDAIEGQAPVGLTVAG
ncbi:RNase adapter RapZ [Qipengyuania spongiae]|uniref:RNase adapter RapZ n=1 Tax=Qipengyuania spongiae TaxID=2909673 RepID=A0ABY5T1Y7_9SPHN|nr:RNase adapter RapZ [Qipengyuania spongiae]UVI40529.1 RNase adapter RapZ [Qipengyuania spongiae]